MRMVKKKKEEKKGRGGQNRGRDIMENNSLVLELQCIFIIGQIGFKKSSIKKLFLMMPISIQIPFHFRLVFCARCVRGAQHFSRLAFYFSSIFIQSTRPTNNIVHVSVTSILQTFIYFSLILLNWFSRYLIFFSPAILLG